MSFKRPIVVQAGIIVKSPIARDYDPLEVIRSNC